MIISAYAQEIFGLNAPAKTQLANFNNLAQKNFSAQMNALFKAGDHAVIDETMKTKLHQLKLEKIYAVALPKILEDAKEGLQQIGKVLENIKDIVSMATEDIYTDQDRQLMRKEINADMGTIDEIAEKYLPMYNKVEEVLSANAAEEDEKFSFAKHVLGLGQIDISTKDTAKNSMAIVEKAQEMIEDALEDMQSLANFILDSLQNSFFKQLERRAAENENTEAKPQSPYSISSPTVSEIEILTNVLLDADAQTLLNNSVKKPETVAFLLR